MATEVGSLYYDLDINDKNLGNQLRNADNKVRAFAQKASQSFAHLGKSMSDIGRKMTIGITLPIVAGAGMAIKAASDLNETINKVDVAFKDQAKTVKKWSETSITSMGLAKGSALDAAALFGDMSTAMGLNTKEAADMSTGLVRLGADMASFKNVSFERAQTALAGVYTGETEALKGLGVVMTQTNLEAFAQSRGIKGNIMDMTQAQKVQLRYAYIMSVTKNAQGDFERTSAGTANQIRIMKERYKELQTEIGAKLLPVANKLLEWVGKIFDKFSALSPKQKTMIMAFLGIAAAVGPVVLILGKLITVMSLLAAHPILLVIGLLVVALVVLQKKFNIVKLSMDPLKKAFDFLKPPVLALWNTIQTQLMPAMMNLWQNVIKPLMPVIGVLFVVAIWALIKVLGIAVSAISKIINFIAAIGRVITPVIRAQYNLSTSIISHIIGPVKSAIGWISRMIDKFNKVTQSIRDALRGVGDAIKAPFKKAFDWISDQVNKLARLIGKLNPSNIAGGAGNFAEKAFKFVSPFAEGTNYAPGGMALVGEKGPELVNLPRGSQVIPNDRIAGAGQTTNIYGDIIIKDKPTADYFFNRLNRNQLLSSMGMSTNG